MINTITLLTLVRQKALNYKKKYFFLTSFFSTLVSTNSNNKIHAVEILTLILNMPIEISFNF